MTYTPASVVSGFMSGVGVIIILIQLVPFVGIAIAGEGVQGALRSLASLRPEAVAWRALALAAGALAIIDADKLDMLSEEEKALLRQVDGKVRVCRPECCVCHR